MKYLAFAEYVFLDVSQNCEKKGRFKHAVDLIRFVRKHFDDFFCIGATIEPEEVIRCSEEYLAHLKNKVRFNYYLSCGSSFLRK